MASKKHDSARVASAPGPGEYAHFERKLRRRWHELRAADLPVDANVAKVARDVQEIRAIERALKRIALGTYGVCVSCGQPIERERLEAYPTANRCAACQRGYERDQAGTPTPRL